VTAVPAGDSWRRQSGPVVRPYAVTGGRTEPSEGEVLDLLTLVVAARRSAAAGDLRWLTPEHRRILGLCEQQVTVADLAADTALPLGVVRVLVADLIRHGAIIPVRQQPASERAGNNVLQEILNGLRAL
jgi:hypothetical protein